MYWWSWRTQAIPTRAQLRGDLGGVQGPSCAHARPAILLGSDAAASGCRLGAWSSAGGVMPSIKERLREGPPLSGYLNLIPSPVATQALAAAGADVVVIDQEHGPIGAESVHAMVAATAGTQCLFPLIRTA